MRIFLDKEYIIFCDESEQKGNYYSNFFGGLIVGSSQYQLIKQKIECIKCELNIYGEMKWEKVTELYLERYSKVISILFEEIIKGNIRIRIMFRQNAYVPSGLTAEQIENEYFLLYYQFIKNAFGLKYVSSITDKSINLRIYLDKLPDTSEKSERFKSYLLALQKSKNFRKSIIIKKENITEVNSHDHVLLQCLDIVLGAIQFRLNNKHKNKISGSKKRGKRTIAKEKLYKFILKEIKKIHKNFNVGISTSLKGDYSQQWYSPYLHWNFVPKKSKFDNLLTKSGIK